MGVLTGSIRHHLGSEFPRKAEMTGADPLIHQPRNWRGGTMSCLRPYSPSAYMSLPLNHSEHFSMLILLVNISKGFKRGEVHGTLHWLNQAWVQ